MNRTRLIVLGCFGAAFASGALAALAWSRVADRPRRPGSWLGHELNLTEEQREQMRTIWSEVMGALREQQREQRRLLLEERDAAIQALLDEGQRVRYAEIMQTYEEESAALEEARRKANEQVIERTKQILTEEQRIKYEEMMKKYGEMRQPPRSRRHRPGTPPPPADADQGDRRGGRPVPSVPPHEEE